MNEKLINISISAIAGLVASFFNGYFVIFCCVMFAIVFDFITGMIKAKVKGEPITSKKGTAGFWRKMGLIAALVFGIFLDVFIPVLIGVVSIELPFKLPIGTICGCYIVINECISIFENINAANPGMLPKWIKNLLKGSKETINKGGKTK